MVVFTSNDCAFLADIEPHAFLLTILFENGCDLLAIDQWHAKSLHAQVQEATSVHVKDLQSAMVS